MARLVKPYLNHTPGEYMFVCPTPTTATHLHRCECSHSTSIQLCVCVATLTLNDTKCAGTIGPR